METAYRKPSSVRDLLLRMETIISVLERNGRDVETLRAIHDGMLLSNAQGRRMSIAKATGIYWAALSSERMVLCGKAAGAPMSAGTSRTA